MERPLMDVIVFEDDKLTAELITEILKPRMHPRSHVDSFRGFDGMTADAIEWMTDSPFHFLDLIILDLGLKDGHGVDVLNFRSWTPRLNIIPVVICSVVDQTPNMIDFYRTRYGVKEFIQKPFLPEELLESVDRVLL